MMVMFPEESIVTPAGKSAEEGARSVVPASTPVFVASGHPVMVVDVAKVSLLILLAPYSVILMSQLFHITKTTILYAAGRKRN